MRHLLIVWHSMTGGTERMASAAADGAMAEEGIEVRLLHAKDATADDVLRAEGYIFATPENLASMSGQMKDFFDRIYYAALDRVNGRPYAILVCAGTDGTGAVRQIQRIATGLRLREVVPAVIVYTKAEAPDKILAPKIIGSKDLGLCHETGAALAAGLAAGIF